MRKTVRDVSKAANHQERGEVVRGELASPQRRLSEAEYLEIERRAQFKSEFFDAELFSMADGSPQHSLIALNAGAERRGFSLF